MTQTPVDQERFNINGGDVTITFAGNLSRQGIEDLEARLVLLIERLRQPHETDCRAWLRGLAELAAYEACLTCPTGKS